MMNINQIQDNIIYTQATGTLTKEDYEKLLPVLKLLLEKHEKIRWLFSMEDFTGWEPVALWKDLQFDIKHVNDFEKIAMVGEKEWQKWLTNIMKPFTPAEILFFEVADREAALKWIKE
ncbi:MAG: STAS/SEC14 domain-containing protein [Chitinophagales bacterium]|nr:STAS/SEC14 domain-containing protein [Bacteroidota bacterium]MCB9064688.1 STAS/SEC14 domain-containing protein [Chitinophagales bacterium]